MLFIDSSTVDCPTSLTGTCRVVQTCSLQSLGDGSQVNTALVGCPGKTKHANLFGLEESVTSRRKSLVLPRDQPGATHVKNREVLPAVESFTFTLCYCL